MMHVITAMATPKMRKKPPTAVGMAATRTSVPVSLTGAVVSVPFTAMAVLTLRTSEYLTVVSGRITLVSKKRYVAHDFMDQPVV